MQLLLSNPLSLVLWTVVSSTSIGGVEPVAAMVPSWTQAPSPNVVVGVCALSRGRWVV